MGKQRKSAAATFVLALIGVLIILWAVGIFVNVCGVRLYLYRNPTEAGQGYLWFGNGTVGFTHMAYFLDDNPFLWIPRAQPLRATNITGDFNIHTVRNNFVCAIPICCLITALLPLAVGAFTRFQFSIRMWIGWTAIIAVQLAYFLPRAYFLFK
jgi:hypothetical protein